MPTPAQTLGLAAGLIAGAAVVATVTLSTGALPDSAGAARLATFHGYCPDDDTSPCTIEVHRVRPLTPSAISEATAANIDPQPFRETLIVRSVTRAVITQFLANNTSPVP